MIRNAARCVIGLAFGSGVVAAADGDVDAGFGKDGIALVGNESAGSPAITLQPDGRILLCDTTLDPDGDTRADFMIARFEADGRLDDSFGTSGRQTIDFEHGSDSCTGIALQADGKVVLAGSTIASDGAHRFAIARLDDDGTPDTAFGIEGRITPHNLGGGNFDRASAVDIQADGRIVVAGSFDTETREKNLGVVRLTSDGSLDTSFGVDGAKALPLVLDGRNLTSLANAVAIDGRGFIVIAGEAGSTDFSGFASVRLLSDGSLDPEFGHEGVSLVDFDSDAAPAAAGASGLALQRDGKIVLAGYRTSSIFVPPLSNSDFALARLMPDGSLDPGFGVDGRVVVPVDLIPRGLDRASEVIELADGKLIAVGTAWASDAWAVAVRVDRHGVPDQDFGESGVRTYRFPQATNFRFTDVVPGDRDVIVSGWANVPGISSDDFLARLAYTIPDRIYADGFDPPAGLPGTE